MGQYTIQRRAALLGMLVGVMMAACQSTPEASTTDAEETTAATESPLIVGSIPDQDPEKVQRQAEKLAAYLSEELGVPVEYQPVTDYAAAVTAFRVGDLDLVWFGALTGVQARLQVEGAAAIAQRDIDEQFTSVFVANTASGIEPFENTSDLAVLKERTFTFGSESSTSGRLMPQYFIQQANVTLDDFKGEVGFSGNHDATIKLVEAGTYEVGALNSEVWESRLAEGEIATDQVQLIWETPPYYNYHWVIHPEVEARYGDGFMDQVQAALVGLDAGDADEQEILDLFSATQFIPTQNENYQQIEVIGRELGKIQ
ncbi:putative selenate ABC transporter substrate-binding protein [Oscillatoria sp. CS-180]|uniref:putative selenate ABC transporter substrate-binding protein n=1 Tax=Oscillatoria sp. CS-180 TaxID=3021720 RepID=UPI00232F4B95|nr:putative selenate ABC transporter substrate-binding protein [Oscillatoria sp. CS-180]MDB9526909.1 putative selenate ABC transporter substrate-binding protein [Oscillatoria sp. CS-180]